MCSQRADYRSALSVGTGKLTSVIYNFNMASAEVCVSPPADVEAGMSPGEFVLKKLLAEFVALSERKLLHIASQPLVS